MKTLRTYALCLLAGILITACTNDDTSPDTGCRLASYTATAQGQGSAQLRSEEATYHYNAQGNLIKADSSWTESNGVSSSSSTTTVNLTYDADDFLTEVTSQTSLQTVSPGNNTNLQRSLRSTFTYTHERVSGYTTRQISFGGLETTVIGTFEYDGVGNLSKQTAIYTYTYDPDVVKEVPVYANGLTRTWVYDQEALVDYYETSGATESRPYTIQDGMVVKDTRPEHAITFEYDAQKRLVKQTSYLQGKINYYFTQEWTAGKPAMEALPVFKGFPQIPASFGKKGIVTKFEFFGDVPGNGISQLTLQTMTSQLNGKQFVTNITTNNQEMYPGGGASTRNRTEVFTYTGCR